MHDMKTLIITGGTGGLGTFVVERLARTYHCVLLKRPEVDLTDDASVRAALAGIDAPYGLVHMAGGWAGGKVSATSSETWSHMMAINATTSFHAIRETLARMDRTRPGRIVAVSSLVTMTKDAGSAAYLVSKSALNALIEATAAELRGTPVTANAIAPNTMATPAAGGSIPLERVADTIEFLLSDAAANITGAIVPLR
jgi:NAD(P)-dependent dehydrogenase (short-subunit alcohol dehydrogenase family)